MTTRWLLPAGALCAFLCPLLLADNKESDWLQFRGPAGRGISADKGLPEKWSDDDLAWKAELPGPGASTPAIIGQRIFLTCYKGYRPNQRDGDQKNLRLLLVCLKRDKQGEIEWTKEIKPRLPEQERIRDDHGYASSSPAVDADRVYVFFGKTGVFAFDHKGKQQWHTEVGDELNGWGSAASPVLHGDLVIVNASVESQTIYALNKKTGKEVWKAEGIKEAWNTPVIGAPKKGDAELVVAVPGKVLGLSLTDGKELWSCASGIRSYMVPSIVVHDGVAYCIGGRTNGSLAVRLGGRGDVTKTHRVWTSSKGGNVSSPVYHDGHLYWMHDRDGIAFCASAKDGTIVYEETIGRAGQVYASAVLGDGKIYYVARHGRTHVVAAKPKYELLQSNDLERRGMFNASPAVAGSKLYLRSDKYLYCIGKK